MRSDIPEQLLTPVLRQRVAQIRESLSANVADHPTLAQWLLPLCAVSPYLARVATQYPDELDRLVNEGLLDSAPVTPDESALSQAERVRLWRDRWVAELEADLLAHRQHFGAVAPEAKALEAMQQRVIRRFRHRHLFRILWCSLTGIADLYLTLEALSVLADTCVCVADELAYQATCERFGLPHSAQGKAQRLIILGMGKLGGYELNVSSDIDLICLWPEAGETRTNEVGRKVVDNGEFFRRSVQAFTRLLNSVTEDGFAYRVDTRLRPFGDSGPLVMNFDGLENYYLTQARDWERYAMIKARAITGNPDDIAELMDLITPFVYRRYLDYNAFDSLRELKRKIALSVHQKGLVDNIKLGAGGIREIEFIGQAFQLVRGGQDKRLRLRSIVRVLDLLAADGLLARTEVDQLQAAYAYLREVENAVQMMRDEQLHSLPSAEEDQQRLIAMMDEKDWAALRARLGTHQQAVMQSFGGLFELESDDNPPSDADEEASTSEARLHEHSLEELKAAWAAFSEDELDDQVRSEILSYIGFDADEELLSTLSGVSRGAFFKRLTSQSQERVSRIVPMIMSYTLTTPEPPVTLNRCVALVRAVAGRSGYLQVLADQPSVLSRLVRLFSQSRWLANFVLRQPMVIDELLTGPEDTLYRSPELIREKTLAQVERIRDAELDVQMDALRHYRQGREMRIACAQLDGTLSLMQVSDQLTWLAESLVEAVLILVEAPLQERHGQPECEENGVRRQTSHAVVAYGKLGGLELGFASDLDLVFLHDSAGNKQLTNGAKSIENSIYYARLAQKFVHFMGTNTPAGMLYEIDLRLRPNGTSGVLVTGINAFEQYQQGDAWTWEHQALIRARMVYGSRSMRERFAQVRLQVLGQDRSEEALREAVAKMRERMRSALGSNQPGRLHLKQDSGGVADIEFVVQYLVLAYSGAHPALLDYTDNIRILEAVEQLSLLPEGQSRVLRESYLALRERLHRQALQEAGSVVPLDPELEALRDRVIAIRTHVLGVA